MEKDPKATHLHNIELLRGEILGTAKEYHPFYHCFTNEAKFNYANFPITLKKIDVLVPYLYQKTAMENVLVSKDKSGKPHVMYIIDGLHLFDTNPDNPYPNKIMDFATFVKHWYCGDGSGENGFNTFYKFLSGYISIQDYNYGTGYESKLKMINLPGGGSKLEPSLENALIILRSFYMCRFFGYNSLTGTIELTAQPPYMRDMSQRGFDDTDVAQLRAFLCMWYCNFSEKVMWDAVSIVANGRSFNPITDFIRSQPKWDGKKRVEELFIKALGAEDSEYTRAATRKFMAGAVKRAFEPGCMFQYMPVLVGEQGIGKSRLFTELLPNYDWFTDALTFSNMDNKSAYEICRGKWFVEIAELSGIGRVGNEYVKRFITQTSDRYREAYARSATDCPRRYVIFGTTNDDRFLSDPTGNRRYWPIYCKAKVQPDWSFMDYEYKRQFWAEAYAIYEEGEELYMDTDMLNTAAKEAQSKAMNENPWVGMIENYLKIPLPEGWYKQSKQARREYIQGVLNGNYRPKDGYTLRERVCTAEIWNELFCGEDEKLKTNAKAIAEALRRVPGIDPINTQKRDKVYGVQTYFSIIRNKEAVTEAATEVKAEAKELIPITDEASEVRYPDLMTAPEVPPKAEAETEVSYFDEMGIPEEPPEPEDYKAPDFYFD